MDPDGKTVLFHACFCFSFGYQLACDQPMPCLLAVDDPNCVDPKLLQRYTAGLCERTSYGELIVILTPMVVQAGHNGGLYKVAIGTTAFEFDAGTSGQHLSTFFSGQINVTQHFIHV